MRLDHCAVAYGGAHVLALHVRGVELQRLLVRLQRVGIAGAASAASRSGGGTAWRRSTQGAQHGAELRGEIVAPGRCEPSELDAQRIVQLGQEAKLSLATRAAARVEVERGAPEAAMHGRTAGATSERVDHTEPDPTLYNDPVSNRPIPPGESRVRRLNAGLDTGKARHAGEFQHPAAYGKIYGDGTSGGGTSGGGKSGAWEDAGEKKKEKKPRLELGEGAEDDADDNMEM